MACSPKKFRDVRVSWVLVTALVLGCCNALGALQEEVIPGEFPAARAFPPSLRLAAPAGPKRRAPTEGDRQGNAHPRALLDPTQAPGQAGHLITGSHTVRARVPWNAPLATYENVGYSMRLESGRRLGKQGERVVEISVVIDSERSLTPFSLDEVSEESPEIAPQVVRLAQSLVQRSRTVDAAVNTLLAWTARSIDYQLDRTVAQDPASVLERRSSYCTGSAALAVALLRAVGIEAREVAGYSLESLGDRPAGYHRWIEVFYPDVGWRFSDPMASVGFVPATYLRLADNWVPKSGADDWVVVFEVDHRRALTTLGALPVGLDGRYQGEPLLGARLRVNILGSSPPERVSLDSPPNEIEVIGDRWIRTRTVVGRWADFVDLAAGEYRVRVKRAGSRRQSDLLVEVFGTGSFEVSR